MLRIVTLLIALTTTSAFADDQTNRILQQQLLQDRQQFLQQQLQQQEQRNLDDLYRYQDQRRLDQLESDYEIDRLLND